MPLLFALTMFVSATLLFLVQPMIGKMVLPLLGGTPAVWNTCMVFYQALLLGGYYYAHKSTTGLETTAQTKLHAGVLLSALGVLIVAAVLTSSSSPIPIVKSLSPQGDDYPFFGVIVLLTVAIGLPFFVVSTSAPLLQKWFADTGHPSSKDPYFLYAASNFGSLLALVAYPALVEPNLLVIHQAWLWAIGYGILVVLVFACARAVNRSVAAAARAEEFSPKRSVAAKPLAAEESDPTFLRKLRWVALAFVPSSLMLGITTFVSTDMASIPLLWIIPLSLYLITFIIVFSKVPTELHVTMSLLMPVSVLLIVFVMTSHVPVKFIWLIALHMLNFFIVTMVCHGELAHDRPSTKHLTSFYLLMSVGGMLGGLFNAFVAPIVFTFTSEYPITLVLACFLLPSMFDEKDRKVSSWTPTLDLLLPLAMFFFCSQVQVNKYEPGCSYFHENGRYMLTCLVLFVLPAVAAVFIFEKTLRARIAVGSFLGGALLLYGFAGPVVNELGLTNELLGLSAGAWLRWAPVAALAIAYAWYCKRYENETFAERLAVGFGALVASLVIMKLLANLISRDIAADMALKARIGKDTVRQILIFGVPAMICYFFVERPIRFGAAVAALWLATFLTEYNEGGESFTKRLFSSNSKTNDDRTFYDRSFFGRLKIEKAGHWEFISNDLLPDDVAGEGYERVSEQEGPDRERVFFYLQESPEHPNKELVYKVEFFIENDKKIPVAYRRRNYVTLVHGTTTHGMQEVNKQRWDIALALAPAMSTNWVEKSAVQIAYGRGIQRAMQSPGREPLTYYHRNGPVGAMFDAWTTRTAKQRDANTDVACIGLGTGTLSAYGRPGQKMAFFEIDTHVKRLVEEPKYFTFIDMAKKQGVNLEFIMGDARVSLERLDRKYGFMLVDAFSSDAIPAHLLTKQAVQLYFQRLEDDGLLAVHISNRYLELEPVVERIVRELGLKARVMHGESYDDQRDPASEIGRFAATWIAIAKTEEALDSIEQDGKKWDEEYAKWQEEYLKWEEKYKSKENKPKPPEPPSRHNRWLPLDSDPKLGLWTDDYSPIIPILRGEWKFW